MMNKSDYLRAKVLDHYMRGVSSNAPSNLYVALFLNNPTSAATGTEVSGENYERQSITFTAPTEQGDAQEITNEFDVEFPQAGNNWGMITHAGIYDSKTGGNMYYFGPLNNPKDIQNSDILKVIAGELKISEA